MADVLTKKQRHYNMSRIRGKWTWLEKKVHRHLQNKKIKHMMHPVLPGKPDLYLPALNRVVFLDGCFWHKCPKCFQKPKTNAKFWEKKINGNVLNDKKITSQLKKEGYSVVRVWECEIKHDFWKALEKITKKRGKKMEIKVHIRKGEKNKKFLKIVHEVSEALKQLPPEGRVKERLLVMLSADKSNLGAAWQDGDDLQNILGKNSGHRFDIYNWNTKTAIEIEESEVKYIWKDLVKLSIGKRRGRLENAILICPLSYGGKQMKSQVPIYSTAIKISEFMSDLLWMENLAIIGYSKS